MGRLVALAIALAGVATAAVAQDRLPPIPEAQLTDAQKAAVAEFRAARNAGLSGPFVPLVRSPELLSRVRAVGDYVRFRSALPPRLSEFTILLVARRWSQNYEWDAHATIARDAGVLPPTIAAIQADRRPENMTDDEATIWAFCDELQRLQNVSDATYARALQRFGEKGVLDLIGISGYYTMLAMVLNTARTPVPGGRPPALSHIPR